MPSPWWLDSGNPGLSASTVFLSYLQVNAIPGDFRAPPEEPLVAVFTDKFPQEVMGFGDWDWDRDVNLPQSQVGSVQEQHA